MLYHLSYRPIRINDLQSRCSKIPLVSRFIEERRYLKNVTTSTLAWYQNSLRAFSGALDSKQTINRGLLNSSSKGISAISVNTWRRCINAYLKWTRSDLKIPRLQEEKKVLRTFSPEDVKRLLTHKTKSKSQARIQSLAICYFWIPD